MVTMEWSLNMAFRKRALMACSNFWNSPFRVGSHHIARGLVRAGFDVAFISDPISPWHWCRPNAGFLRERLDIYRRGGVFDLDGRLWTYVPAALLTPHNKPILKSEMVHRNWHHWTWPNLTRLIREHNFNHVDLLYIDSLQQSCWLDLVSYRHSVYRVADYNPHFEKYTRATRLLEQEMARRVDRVVYPSQKLGLYAEELGAKHPLLLPNGVDFAHFACSARPRPAEYRDLHGPIAVYVGVIPEWFHFDWVRAAAIALPDMSFVLIGPDKLARARLSGMPNVRVLGMRDYAVVPAYLQHADVGLMPFDVAANPRGVEVLQPQKLFAYLASGLPVVASDWENLRLLGSPARRCATEKEFIEALWQATADPGNPHVYRRYASQFDWQLRVNDLLREFDLPLAA